jgi:flagellar motor switch protein FliG
MRTKITCPKCEHHFSVELQAEINLALTAGEPAETGSSPDSYYFENCGNLNTTALYLLQTTAYADRRRIHKVASILRKLKRNSPELVYDLCQWIPERFTDRLMFEFEDISKLADPDIGAILKNVETQQWAIALQGASDTLKEKIFKNVSKRSAKMLQEEIEYVNTQPSDIAQAQEKIVDVLWKLEDAGEVTLPRNSHKYQMEWRF